MNDELQIAYDDGCVAGFDAGKAYGYRKGREDAAKAIRAQVQRASEAIDRREQHWLLGGAGPAVVMERAAVIAGGEET